MHESNSFHPVLTCQELFVHRLFIDTFVFVECTNKHKTLVLRSVGSQEKPPDRKSLARIMVLFRAVWLNDVVSNRDECHESTIVWNNRLIELIDEFSQCFMFN